jgi:hypothetical protein
MVVNESVRTILEINKKHKEKKTLTVYTNCNVMMDDGVCDTRAHGSLGVVGRIGCQRRLTDRFPTTRSASC